MDVEAQDDGVMAKIVVPSGSKGVPVGKLIAVLAEPGDDLSTLKMPAESGGGGEGRRDKELERATPARDQHAASPVAASTAGTARATRPQHHPSPSVLSLLRAHNISAEDSMRIAGTGPKGRLLKGDILAHLGKISRAAPGELEARLKKLQKLDLSNIKVAPPKPKSKPAAPKRPEVPPLEKEIKVEVDLFRVSQAQKKLGLPLESFLTAAAGAANNLVEQPPLPPTVDELFNDILGLPNVPSSRPSSFSPPELEPRPLRGGKKADVDIYDLLVGAPEGQGPKGAVEPDGTNLLSLKVPAPDEERATEFLHMFRDLLQNNPEALFPTSKID